jgi:hypothetical protein
MKKFFFLLMIVIILTAGAACPRLNVNQPYNLGLQYQFTPGMETFSTITGTFSDPAQTTFHGYQYSLSVEPPEGGGLDWSDLSRVVMTSPLPINSQSDIESCYTGTGIDPFSGKDTRYVDFYCGGGAFLPDTPPSGTYTISAPRSAGTGTQTLILENISPIGIAPDLYGILVPSVKLTRDIDGYITRIDWAWWKKDNTDAWVPALDSELAAALDVIILEIGSVNSTETVSIDVSTIKSASGSIVPPAQTFAPARFSFFFFDKARYGYFFDWLETAQSISMTTPYVNSSDVESIRQAFSSAPTPYWNVAHPGIDFYAYADHMQFQASVPGIIEEVRASQNVNEACLSANNCNWQIGVRIRYDSAYSVEWDFEPFSSSEADKDIQLANISVAVGDVVQKGDIIGTLHRANDTSHVDWGIMKNYTLICPEPYFSAEAKSSILALIKARHPTWEPEGAMCF